MRKPAAVDAQFYANRCASTGPDVGGAALQVFSQYQGRTVWIVNSMFGGAGALRNECANGGAISSIGVSWTFLNSWLRANRAVGTGANRRRRGHRVAAMAVPSTTTATR